MYGICHINGTWGSTEVGQLKLSYEGGKTQRKGLFWGELTPLDTKKHTKTYHFLDISLHSSKGYSRYKTNVKVKNNLIQASLPLIKNNQEIRIC